MGAIGDTVLFVELSQSRLRANREGAVKMPRASGGLKERTCKMCHDVFMGRGYETGQPISSGMVCPACFVRVEVRRKHQLEEEAAEEVSE